MSDDAKRYRAENKAKAKRMAEGNPHAKVDASDWSPPEPLNADAQTGMRPVSRVERKRGGKVDGAESMQNAGRRARKSGGRALVNDFSNRDMKAANEERAGVKHRGGLKTGGRASGGMSPSEGAAAVPTNILPSGSTQSRLSKIAGLKTGGRAKRNIGGDILGSGALGLAGMAARRAFDDDGKPATKKRGGSVSDGAQEGTRPTGGRSARASGGRTGKGKMNVNIIIAQPKSQETPPMGAGPMAGPAMPPPMPPPRPPVAPSPSPPPTMGGGAPGPMAGMPPPGLMPRKRGGRIHMEAGAGSGPGRKEKIEEYGAEARNLDGHY